MICEIVSAGARTVTSNDVVMISTRRFVPVVVIFVAVTFAVSSPRTEMRTVASVTPLRFFRSFPKGIVTVASYDVAKLDRSTVATTSWLSFCSTVVSPATWMLFGSTSTTQLSSVAPAPPTSETVSGRSLFISTGIDTLTVS